MDFLAFQQRFLGVCPDFLHGVLGLGLSGVSTQTFYIDFLESSWISWAFCLDLPQFLFPGIYDAWNPEPFQAQLCAA